MNTDASPVTGGDVPLGAPVPPDCPHALLCSIPTWTDIVEYMDRKERVVKTLKTAYPRLKLHTYVKQLSKICSDIHGKEDEECLLFPSLKNAEYCQEYVLKHAMMQQRLRIVRFSLPLFAVLFPSSSFPQALPFWVYTGTGISTRLAEHCLSALPIELLDTSTLTMPLAPRSWRNSEFYNVHRPLESGAEAKTVIRRLFSGIINEGPENIRGVPYISPDDVYLYSTGMNAIWNVHLMVLHTQSKETKCAALLYSHTHDVLENWGPGYHFLSNGSIDDLETLLALEYARNPNQPPISALYLDFPANPLLRSPDVPRLRKLADQYGFPLIIDETVGNFLNTQLLPYADIVTCSLTKVFSGLANVMGGAFLLNPASKHYPAFKAYMDTNYEDTYFSEDAICIEANSRDMKRRVRMIDRNAEVIADFCYEDSLKAESVIKQVLYPKYQMREHYEHCWSKATDNPGYGGLLTLSFISNAAAMAFFDALPCYKAVTLGTVFTLAVPFAEAGFHDKLEWAQENGIDYASVRFSIGMEDLTSLRDGFKAALTKAAAEHVASFKQK
ncbi:pyridoxal phosphate-dependent transferase [Desarmillaria tabescens]|uniref:Pyridoxal phosphate-dependent transferase n=1 Tax=Armillaria tabescens TaxID=1929756 RepID=A0AA39MLJ2_ARMTA|nr:pyridoxal phosphate-dependent transferase [Desarmillaria tabescens]KAK0438333.1 pyridoxal phosphate-dependent transferase [Desarmillaria tabescens]